jgi:hypothetical protein
MDKNKKWWIVAKDTKGGHLNVTDLLYNSKEEAEEHLKVYNIKTFNLKHIDTNSIKIEMVSSGINWEGLYDSF